MGLLNNFRAVSGKWGGKMTKNKFFSYFSSLNIYQLTCKVWISTWNGRMKLKLTLKTILLGISITILNLQVLTVASQGENDQKRDAFYIFLHETFMHWPASMNNQLEIVGWNRNWPLRLIPAASSSQFGTYWFLKWQIKKCNKKNRVFFIFLH